MDEVLIVGVLQGRGDGQDIGNHGGQRQPGALWVQLAQVAMGRVVHHQVGCGILQAKVEDANDMRMHQLAQVASFGEEGLAAVPIWEGVQDFESHMGIEIVVLSQVDVGKGPRTKQVDEPIIAQALSSKIHATDHACSSYLSYTLLYERSLKEHHKKCTKPHYSRN